MTAGHELGIHRRSAAKRALETPDCSSGGGSGIDEDRIDRAPDVFPRAGGGSGHALESSCCLAPLRLQEAQLGARVVEQFANPRTRIDLELTLRVKQAPLDFTDRFSSWLTLR